MDMRVLWPFILSFVLGEVSLKNQIRTSEWKVDYSPQKTITKKGTTKFDMAKEALEKDENVGPKILHFHDPTFKKRIKVRRATTTTAKRRRTAVTNLVPQNEIDEFFEDLSPIRSTLPPSTAAVTREIHTATPKSIMYGMSSGIKRNTVRQQRKREHLRRAEAKVIRIKPVKMEKEAARYLRKLLERESANMRKNVIRRKIEEVKGDLERLEASKSRKSMEFVDNLARSIEEQELEMQGKTVTKVPQATSNGFFSLNNITLRQPARIRSSGQTFWLFKKKGGGVSSHYVSSGGRRKGSQTEVNSSPVIIEGTTPAPYQFNKVTDGEVKHWTRASPMVAPTMDPQSVLTATLRPLIFGSINVDGESRKGLSSLEPLSVPLVDNDIIHSSDANKPPYPFSHCYLNKDGLMCCNRFLESLIRKSYQKLVRTTKINSCSLQKIANRIQSDCEQVFNTTFEVIVGSDDYALRAHFAGDLMCKIEQENRFITVYAHTMPIRNGIQRDPLSVITPIALNTMEDMQTSPTVSNTKEEGLPIHELSREDVDNETHFSNDISA